MLINSDWNDVFRDFGVKDGKQRDKRRSLSISIISVDAAERQTDHRRLEDDSRLKRD